MKVWNRKKEQSDKEKERYGYELLEPFGNFETGRLSICLWKAILMFCASLGTIGSIVSAFHMNVNMPVIVLAFLTMSLALSFLHYHHVLFNIGYPVVFILFAVSIFQNRRYVNSGYQAVVNLIKEDYREYFQLNYSGEAYEAIDDRYVTMTYAFIYLGFFLLVLLNIAISTYMSILLTMLLTFPFLQFGLYIGKMPSLFFILLLLFVYTAVLFLKRSGHYSLSEKKKKDRPFVVKKEIFSYKGHGKTMGQLVGAAFVLSLVFSLVAYPVMQLSLPGAEKTSALKAQTDSAIQMLVQSGFSSLFNRYEATGGISGGRLGGVNRVSADYETDLEVTFVPTSLDPVYLKAFTGASYTGNQWERPAYDEGFSSSEELHRNDYESSGAYQEAKRLGQLFSKEENGGQQGKMSIKNVGANAGYLYLPYYTAEGSGISATIDHGVLYGDSPVNQSYTINYYPYAQVYESALSGTGDLPDTGETEFVAAWYLQKYEADCREVYTEIPNETVSALANAMAEIGEGKTTGETVALIQNYFAEQFQYSLNPGATPLDKDFASYFLEVQKKGYCAHFATAGTLLCRAYGIPARYVEGYVIQTTDITDAKAKEDADVGDWFSGTSALAKTGVVTVSVPDANAHAWTEIYIDGFGWVPVDFTPPAEDVDVASEYRSFLQLFAGLFSVQGNQNAAEGSQATGQNAGTTTKVFTDNSFFLMPIVVLLLAGLTLWFAWRMFLRLRRRLGREAAYRAGRFDEVLVYDYKRLLFILKKKKVQIPLPSLPREIFSLLDALHPERKEDTRRAEALFEAGVYGREQLAKEDADFFIRYAKEISRALKRGKYLL